LKQVVILGDAAEDIEAARDFYDTQEPGVGEYCVDSLLADIESLGLFSGVHPLHFDFHRMLASRFPFGITIANMATKLRCSRFSICDAIQIGFARN
jgi:hypothetical protein